MSRSAQLSQPELTEALDRVLHKGAVLQGTLVVSVADVDLLYLDLRVILSSVDTAMQENVLASDASSGNLSRDDSP